MNLLDTIKQNSQNLATQQQGMTDETARTQKLLRAKSGRAGGEGDIAASSLGEQSANSLANQQLQNEVAPQAQLQQQGLEQSQAQVQQNEANQKQDISQARRFDDLQTKLKTNQLLSDLERNKGQIDLNRDKSSLDQLAFNLRMQNKSYVDNLQLEGSKSRLDNSNNFSDQLSRSILGDNEQLLNKQLGDQSVLSASNRDFTKAMAQMNIDTAYDYFKADMASAKQGAMIQGVSSLATAGIGAYGNAQDSSAKKDYYTTGGGQNENSYEASKYRKD